MIKELHGNDVEIEIVVRDRGAHGRPTGQAGHTKVVLTNYYAGLQERKLLAALLEDLAKTLLGDRKETVPEQSRAQQPGPLVS